jgi:hypothetical protein
MLRGLLPCGHPERKSSGGGYPISGGRESEADTQRWEHALIRLLVSSGGAEAGNFHLRMPGLGRGAWAGIMPVAGVS